jgi:uncharacterized membrane protein
MALDHVRDFFGPTTWGGPENVRLATPALFFTRWITHFCAPTFVFLAGVSAYLSGKAGQSRAKLAGYLILRGLLLVLLELTIVKFGWTLQWSHYQSFTMLQVIWAIGWSMVLLGFLVWLPPWLIGLFGLTIIFGHNYLDGLTGAKLVKQWEGWSNIFGEKAWLWDMLLTSNRAFIPEKGYAYYNLYPIVPWFGIMAAGYGLGPLFRWKGAERRKLLFFLGAVTVILFFVVRLENGYGDPKPWREQKEPIRTLMSFLNCEKYPPSLAYVLMTLGPSLIALALFDLLTELVQMYWKSTDAENTLDILMELSLGLFTRFFLVFGRVPLFFYLIHLPTIHGLAKLTARWLEQKPSPFSMSPLGKGFDLETMYAIWVGIVLLLFLPCLGYGWLKKVVGGPLKLL